MKNHQKDIVKQLTDKKLLINFYFSQAIIFLIAIILGFIFFPGLLYVFQLFHFSDIHRILMIGGGTGIIVVLIDFIMMSIFPSSFFDDGGINERLFKDRGFFHILFMTLLVAFCEELLFRGVLQTKFGLIAASLIFAIVHFRYLSNLFLLIDVVILSFFIGLIYEWTDNLAVPFVMHFVIDCLLGLSIYYKFLPKHK